MSSNKIIIGQCKYNPATRKIYRADGQVKKIGRVPADLLELFISKPNYYFSLQELQSSIWSDKAIEQATVARWISTLRKELGETTELIYIENKRSEGYRLIVEVKKHGKNPINKLKVFMVLLLVVTPAVLKYSNILETKPPSTPQTLTTLIGQELDGTFNNELLIYSHKSLEGKYWNLKAKHLNSGRSFSLTNNKYDERRATFSHDGKRIAFQRVGNKKCEIIVATINRSLMKLENFNVVHDCKFDRVSVVNSWKDSNTLFLSMRESVPGKFRIFTLDMNSGELVKLIEPPNTGMGDYYVTYSNQTNELVFFRNIGRAITEIWSYDTITEKSKLLYTVPLTLFSLAWVNDDTELVFRVGNGKIAKMRLSPLTLPKEIMSVNYPIRWLFSMTSHTFGYVHGHLRVRDIVKASLNTSVEVIASSSSHDYMPVYSQESETLAFVSTRTGQHQVWIMSSSGELLQLSKNTEKKITDLAISNDGQAIAYTLETQIFVISRSGEILFSSPKDVIYKNPTFSLDSKTLYYSINYGDSWRLEKRELTDILSSTTLTEGYYIKPCSGYHCFYYLKHNMPELYKFENGVNRNTQVKLPKIHSSNQFAITNDIIHYTEQENDKIYLKQYDMKQGSVEVVTQLPHLHFSLDITNHTIYSITTREKDIKLEKASISKR